MSLRLAYLLHVVVIFYLIFTPILPGVQSILLIVYLRLGF